MTKTKAPDPKLDALRQHGILNPHPQRVSARWLPRPTSSTPTIWFRSSTRCFDMRSSDGVTKAEAARPVRLVAAHLLPGRGRVRSATALAGLLPQKRGPQVGAQAHARSDGRYRGAPSRRRPVAGSRAGRASCSNSFGVKVHPRSIERAIARGKKNADADLGAGRPRRAGRRVRAYERVAPPRARRASARPDALGAFASTACGTACGCCRAPWTPRRPASIAPPTTPRHPPARSIPRARAGAGQHGAGRPSRRCTHDALKLHQKVTAGHLRRDAFLYVRQSTLRQVFENTESTERQYALRQRAVALGWPIERRHRHRQRSGPVRRPGTRSRRLPEAGHRGRHGPRRHRARAGGLAPGAQLRPTGTACSRSAR